MMSTLFQVKTTKRNWQDEREKEEEIRVLREQVKGMFFMQGLILVLTGAEAGFTLYFSSVGQK